MRKRDGRGQGGQWAAVKGIRGAAVRALRGDPSPGVAIDGRDARWIWSSKNAQTAAAGETAYFRKTFTLAAPSNVTRVIATADNELDIYVDGKRIASTKAWETPVKTSLDKPLAAGSHTIAAKARNAGSGPNPASTTTGSRHGRWGATRRG
jgi:hypothetical protein